jgi:hypothetical protein
MLMKPYLKVNQGSASRNEDLEVLYPAISIESQCVLLALIPEGWA